MKYAKIVNNIVIQTQPNEETGFVQVPDNTISGMIKQTDGSFIAPAQDTLTPFLNSIQAELDRTDLVAIRCLKAGAAFPLEWQTYTTDLRALLSSTTAGVLPTKPPYPANT